MSGNAADRRSGRHGYSGNRESVGDRTVRISGSACLQGEVHLPADKSIAHRAALLSALADGTSRIVNYPASADPQSTLACLRALGVRIETQDDILVIHGTGLYGLSAPDGPLDCGNSGTTMRLLAGVAAGVPGLTVLTGDASLQYLVDMAIPAQVVCDCSDVKLLLLLRDPTRRAYSSYRMHQRLGYETRCREDVVDAELAAAPLCPLRPENIPRHFDPRMRGDYLVRSAALPFLRRWLAHFPPERFLILQHENLRRDAAATVRRVYRFLELPDFVPDCAEWHNVGHYEPMSPEIRQRLEDWFAPHQHALSAPLADNGMAPPCAGG